MNLSTAIIDGTLKLVALMTYKGKLNCRTKPENVLRIYNPSNSNVPESVMYESKTTKGVFIDEVNDKMYKQLNGKLVAL